MLSFRKWGRTGLAALMVTALLSGSLAWAKKPAPPAPEPEPDPPPVIYSLTLFDGMASIYVTAMNEAGDVVRFAYPNDVESAFVYTPDWGLVDLNTMLPEGFDGHLERAYGTNNNGQIIGQVAIDGEDDNYVLTLPAEVDDVVEVTVLGKLHTDDRWLRARGINDVGEVVGHGSHVNSERFAWYYHDFFALTPLMESYPDISVTTINNNGVVLGHFYDPYSVIFKVVPETTPEFFYGDGDPAWEAEDMSDSGSFVGYRGVEVPVNKRKTRYTTRAFRQDGTTLIDIAGDDSHAYAINNNGDVIGVSASLGGRFVYLESLHEAFCFDDAVVGDPGDMLIWDDPYKRATVEDINNSGQLCGKLQVGDTTTGIYYAGYILTPITGYPPSPAEE